MSPVNDIVVEDEPVQKIELARMAVAKVTGASETLPLRLIVLFVVAVVCSTLAPIPWNGVGVAAVVLLALDTAMNRRAR